MRHLPTTAGLNIADEIAVLESKAGKLLRQAYSKLTPWQKVQVARHPERPHCIDYIAALVTEFTPLAGDRNFAEDEAIVGGLARFRDRPVVIMGTEKGSDTNERVRHNFGMAKPEGYRKAARLFELAERFRLPVITLVDTAGAYPGSKPRRAARPEAIARSIETSLRLTVPVVATIIGEGGSGGAGRARQRQRRADARTRDLFGDFARGLRLDPVAQRRPGAGGRGGHAADGAGSAEARRDRPHHRRTAGGAHRDRVAMSAALGNALEETLKPLLGMSPAAIKQQRREKFLAIGARVL